MSVEDVIRAIRRQAELQERIRRIAEEEAAPPPEATGTEEEKSVETS
jgi:hypothetical protein